MARRLTYRKVPPLFYETTPTTSLRHPRLCIGRHHRSRRLPHLQETSTGRFDVMTSPPPLDARRSGVPQSHGNSFDWSSSARLSRLLFFPFRLGVDLSLKERSVVDSGRNSAGASHEYRRLRVSRPSHASTARSRYHRTRVPKRRSNTDEQTAPASQNEHSVRQGTSRQVRNDGARELGRFHPSAGIHQ